MNHDEIVKKISEFEEEITKLSNTLKELKELVGQRDNIPMQKISEKPLEKKVVKTNIKFNPDMFDIGEDGILYEYLGNAKNVVIPDGVRKIGAQAFLVHTEIKTIEIPDSVTEIGERAFYNCYCIVKIRLSDNIQSIGDKAFYDCVNIERIRLSDNVKSIGEKAFWGCDKLKISVPYECKFGTDAFNHCAKVIYRGR